MDKQEKLEQFRKEMIKSQELSQKQIEEGIKDFLTDNPMMQEVVMISREKPFVAGKPIANIVNIARVMIQHPIFKEMVKKALKIADGDYEIIKEHYHNSQKIIDSIFEQ